tara:strand:+ start:2635 stop:3747 length:1113 start_codon:yes stop_codon:yes gene_type:complete
MSKIFQFDRITIILLIFFLLFTNTYYGVHEVNSSASSSYYYLDIANSFPGGTSIGNIGQAYIHGERFLISYLIGLVSYLLNINNFYIFIILSYSSIFFLIVLNYKIICKLIPNNNTSTLFLSLFLLNPYIVRYALTNPIMLNDLVFIISISLLFLSFLNKKNILFYISIILAIISRQTSILIILALFFTLVLPYKNDFISINKILISLLLFIFNFIIAQFYLEYSNLDVFYGSQFFGLLSFLQYNFDLIVLFKFIFYPFLSFGPLLALIFFFLIKKNINFVLTERNIFFIILLILFFSQPFLSGPYVAGKNIIRLSTFGYSSLIFLLCLNIKNIENISKKVVYLFITITIIWSLHPTFSTIKIFEFIRIN